MRQRSILFLEKAVDEVKNILLNPTGIDSLYNYISRARSVDRGIDDLRKVSAHVNLRSPRRLT